MINTKNENVREILKELHKTVIEKTKGGTNTKDEMIIEGRIFSAICENFDIQPRECAEFMNRKYGYDMTGDEVIQILRGRRMSKPAERKEIFQWAEKVADSFAAAVEGNAEAFEKFEKIRKDSSFRSNNKRHKSQGRIAVIMTYEKYPELDPDNDVSSIHMFGDVYGNSFLRDMSAIVAETYDFSQSKGSRSENEEKDLTYEQALKRIRQLENTLDRTNIMLRELQDEFNEQLEISKVKELTDFFVKLNSEKYGCILDELLVVRKGVDELRKSNYELPIEINGLLIMVKKLIQFVRDSHIEPMMKVNSVREVTAADVEFCSYDGTPFTDPNEKKKIKVISPGWVYKDKELQISRPKVKEE